MESLKVTIPTFLTFGFSFFSALYFLARFLIRRNLTSLAIVSMSSGWCVAALVINGELRNYYDALRWLGMVASAFLLASVLMVEFWEDYRRSIERENLRILEEEALKERARKRKGGKL